MSNTSNPSEVLKIVTSSYGQVFLILVLIAIFCASGFNTSRQKEAGRPVVVPSWIPWLGSAFTMAMDPDAFILRNKKKYGPAFFVDVIGLRFLYITAQEPIKGALKKPKDISIRGVEFDSLQSIFDLSKVAAAAETTHGTAFKILSRETQKWSVQDTVTRFRDVFDGAVQEFQERFTPADKIHGKVICFSEVFFPLIYRSFSRAALGTTYPGETLWKEHNEFHNAFPVLFSGLPASWVPGGVKARAKLSEHVYALLEKHLCTSNPTSDSAPIFMKIMAKVMGVQSDMSMQDAAKMVNLYMFAGDNIGLGAFWIISRALAHPGLYEQLLDEADRAWKHYKQHHPIVKMAATESGAGHEWEARETVFNDMLADISVLDKGLPLLDSVFKEMLRWHGKQMFVRRAEVDLLLPLADPTQSLVVHKGDNIILYMRPTHFDEERYQDPHTFNPERFLAAEGKQAGDIDEGKNGFMLPFGFGKTVCPGRYLASFEIKVVILSILHTFDLEYVSVTGPLSFWAHRGPGMDKSIPCQNLTTFGTPLSMPFGDLKTRLRLRKGDF